jgi:hypothetical protein
VTPKSAIFLGGSCVAFIAFTGSIFELASGQPDLGNLMTTAILAVSLPLGAYLFFAAVRDTNIDR